ncbi:MAG: hypothetical protein GXY80_12425, partial [Syntrophorhabdus aromaticivorans]|nr:hypothetical protein [Syntrophorhabdus aromaticivorans]
MKKSILLILCLTFVTMPSLASVDINTLSDEELLLLHAQVRQALYDRSNIESIEMPPGTYEAGKDFPAGSYTIKNLSEDDDIF